MIGSDPIHSTRYGYRRVATPLALGARDRKFDSYYPYHKYFSDEIGSHSGLRNHSLIACRFESDLKYHIEI